MAGTIIKLSIMALAGAAAGALIGSALRELPALFPLALVPMATVGLAVGIAYVMGGIKT